MLAFIHSLSNVNGSLCGEMSHVKRHPNMLSYVQTKRTRKQKNSLMFPTYSLIFHVFVWCEWALKSDFTKPVALYCTYQSGCWEPWSRRQSCCQGTWPWRVDCYREQQSALAGPSVVVHSRTYVQSNQLIMRVEQDKYTTGNDELVT